MVSNSGSKILQWVVSLESHHNGGSHFHMAIKLSTTPRWRAIRRFVDNKHSFKINVSESHTNYYTAYEYVTKEDPNFVLSPGHPDLANTSTPNTTNATRRRQSKAAAKVTKSKGKKKGKRLAVYDVVRIIQTKKIQTRLQLMALAD